MTLDAIGAAFRRATSSFHGESMPEQRSLEVIYEPKNGEIAVEYGKASASCTS
jgi:hypothetical protein